MNRSGSGTASLITLRGRVQGVGFRPFVFRLATEAGVNGWVRNTNEGVTIFLEGKANRIDRFVSDLRRQAPAASSIGSIQVEEVVPQGHTRFEIRPSLNLSAEITEISPDIAVCADCLADMKRQPHRIGYPLINCTHCGPRFTIIRDLPYDRPNTTMEPFPMCSTCREEYENVMDRRFHAQPVACNRCGPAYELWRKGELVETAVPDIIREAVGQIRQGKTVALKGVGGFHLVCDAGNQQAVSDLRLRKGREKKPLAVMFRDSEAARRFVCISATEEAALESWQRPIVLLALLDQPADGLAPGVNEGLSTLGVVLPYMPFHYLLMENSGIQALVLTSGNLSEQPIIIDNASAIDRFRSVADLVITHQRDIYNRVDDSVVKQLGGRIHVIRRARGYCPDPVPVSLDVDGILSLGGELVNTFCAGKGKRAYLSQHIGDLKNPSTQEFYLNTCERFRRLFRLEPECIVTDLHPEYYSTKTGLDLQKAFSRPGLKMKLERVQHHHAHIASCMAEHHLDEEVIGVAFDGTGLGTDGHNWGSEVMVADLARFERVTHFDYLMMPGGDKAVHEPWRMACSALHHAFGKDVPEEGLPMLNRIDAGKREWIHQMLQKGVNTPLTCGAGRYFDAVAALLGICLTSGYEGEGPMKLEALVREGIEEEYPLERRDPISFAGAFRMLVQDIQQGVRPEVVATKFHNTVITAIVNSVYKVHTRTGLDKVVLSGGVFQNRYLVDHLVPRLEKEKLLVYLHASVPPNDGGISLGQLMVAAKRRAMKT